MQSSVDEEWENFNSHQESEADECNGHGRARVSFRHDGSVRGSIWPCHLRNIRQGMASDDRTGQRGGYAGGT